MKATPGRKKLKSKQTSYYEWYLLCPGCNEMYMVEDAKRMIENSLKSMFDESDGEV